MLNLKKSYLRINPADPQILLMIWSQGRALSGKILKGINRSFLIGDLDALRAMRFVNQYHDGCGILYKKASIDFRLLLIGQDRRVHNVTTHTVSIKLIYRSIFISALC
jgi:hypothetical protein